MTDTATTNGKQPADLRSTAGGPPGRRGRVGFNGTSGGYQADIAPPREKEKSLLVKPRTHQMVREASKRLGRSTDAVVRAGVRLLNEATAGEKAVDDDNWADGIGGK